MNAFITDLSILVAEVPHWLLNHESSKKFKTNFFCYTMQLGYKPTLKLVLDLLKSLSSNPPETPSSLAPIQIGQLESHLLCTKTWMQQWDGAWSFQSNNQISRDFLYHPYHPPASLYMAGEACGKQLKGTVWGAGYRWSLSQDNHLR